MSQRRIIWLASYPKSGNTWTRIFLANMFLPQGQAPDINHLFRFTTSDVRKDFFDRAAGGLFTGGSVEDWLRVRPAALRLIAGSKQGHHFVKTHCQIKRLGNVDLIPADVTAAAIYLMRNPFDVALSFARHLSVDVDTVIGRMTDENAMMGSDGGVLEFIGRWDDNLRTWIDAPGLACHVIRYEDMLADPEQAFRGLLGFLKAPVDDGAFQRALEASRFSTLQREEKLKGFHERPRGMKQFFATGTSGGWRERLTPDQVARLRGAFLPTLEQHYPELLEDTAAAAEAKGSDA